VQFQVAGSDESLWSRVVGVTHPVQSLANVGSADARSAQIGTPEGISITLQVSTNSGEPLPAILSRNLFSKDRCRAALGDEAVKSGPEVSFVDMALPESRDRKRLTWTASGPDGSIVGPSRRSEGMAPDADSGEEVML
jgi:hypothetical protein